MDFATCKAFLSCHIVVLGDVMLDRYWHGAVDRISPEAPVPIVNVAECKERLGGAANVAANVRALGPKVTLIGGVGEDEAGACLRSLLEAEDITHKLMQSKQRQTTLKLRVLGQSQQLVRLDFEDKTPWPFDKIMGYLMPLIKQRPLLILSDYAKGMIADPQQLIQYAKKNGMKILVDPKRADLTVYQDATILTPNLNEFEAMVGRCASVADIEEKGMALLLKMGWQALLVTRGAEGLSLLQPKAPPVHIPTQAKEIFDVTGAGDTVIAVLAAGVASGATFLQAAQWANVAAGYVVSQLGTAAIGFEQLKDQLMMPMGENVLPILLADIKKRKAKGQKIVMTNGCFDILHAGHVTYLQKARALGACLIVAINDDASVQRLKGKTRPIHTLKQRIQVLKSLACVDYVISFAKDTPLDLIEQLSPDILVKGGDYQKSQIVGAKEVLAKGGQVVVLPLVAGCSTTQTVEKIKKAPKVLTGEEA